MKGAQMQIAFYDLDADVYQRRSDWWAWLAILTLQLECAHAAASQDFWHFSIYKNAIKGIVS